MFDSLHELLALWGLIGAASILMLWAWIANDAGGGDRWE